ncbi:MAG: nucleoside/nucleotide kinase family protein [Nakamurella sp.]
MTPHTVGYDSVATAIPLTTAELVERVQVLAKPGERRILGIAGAPGAGKSSLAALLARALGPNRAALADMDAFHLSNEILHHVGRHGYKGAIDTFDDAGYASLIQRLAAAAPGERAIYVPRFEREIEESINAAVAIPSEVPLVITDGNYLLAETGAWPNARSAMSEVWFLAPAREVRHAQLIARHQQFGRTLVEAEARALGTDEINAQLVLGTASRADLILRWQS